LSKLSANPDFNFLDINAVDIVERNFMEIVNTFTQFLEEEKKNPKKSFIEEVMIEEIVEPTIKDDDDKLEEVVPWKGEGEPVGKTKEEVDAAKKKSESAKKNEENEEECQIVVVNNQDGAETEDKPDEPFNVDVLFEVKNWAMQNPKWRLLNVLMDTLSAD
jgi:hypothetical protein